MKPFPAALVLPAALLLAGLWTLRVCAASLVRPARAPAHNGSPGDPNILYLGRWDRSRPEAAHGYWTCVYLQTRFTGTSVGITLDSGTQLFVQIDGEPGRMLGAGAGITALNTLPLKPGVHTLLIGAAGQNEEVGFQGLTLDPGARTLPVARRPVIEFVGDSITVIDGPGNFSWQAAEALGCDHTQIAFSGVALTSGYGCSTKVGMDVQYFRLKNFNHADDSPPVAWDFSAASYIPRIIVINLGQNDQCGSEPDAVMQESYTRFVRSLRAKFPAARIVALRPFGGPYAAPIRQAIDSLRTAGDTRVSYVDTTGWLAPADFLDGVHPNKTGQAKVTAKLIPLLKPLL